MEILAATETVPTPGIETWSKEDVDQPWQVVIYDDPVNLMSFVTLVIQRIFGYPRERARHLMLEVHNLGRSIVWTGGREKAEFFVQQLHTHQLQAAMEQVDD